MEEMPTAETSYVGGGGASSEPILGANVFSDIMGGDEDDLYSVEEKEELFSPSTIMHILFGKLEILPVDPERIDLTRGEQAGQLDTQ